ISPPEGFVTDMSYLTVQRLRTGSNLGVAFLAIVNPFRRILLYFCEGPTVNTAKPFQKSRTSIPLAVRHFLIDFSANTTSAADGRYPIEANMQRHASNLSVPFTCLMSPTPR